MLLQLGPLATHAAGSIGGLTVQRSPFGAVARVKPIPTKRQHTAGSTARQKLAACVRHWQSLSPDQHASWQQFSQNVPWFNRFGAPVVGNGYRAFLRANAASFSSTFAQDPVPLLSDPPFLISSILPANLGLTGSKVNGVLTLTSSDTEIDKSTILVLFGTAPASPARYSTRPWYRYMGSFEADTRLPLDTTEMYHTVFQSLPSRTHSQQVSILARAYNSTSRWPGVSTILPLNWI